MPTLRLNDEEKHEIRSAFNKVLDRALNNLPFPLTEDDFPEFAYSLLDDTTRSHYQWLRESNKVLTSAATWCPVMEFAGPSKLNPEEYSITFGSGIWLPYERIKLLESNPRYREIYDWTRQYCDVKDRVSDAQDFLYSVVEHCCSTGQVKRVLSEDILRFLPQYMHQYWNDAERQSRWPSKLPADCQPDIQHLADTLALGSLSPENREGLGIEANRH